MLRYRVLETCYRLRRANYLPPARRPARELPGASHRDSTVLPGRQSRIGWRMFLVFELSTVSVGPRSPENRQRDEHIEEPVEKKKGPNLPALRRRASR